MLFPLSKKNRSILPAAGLLWMLSSWLCVVSCKKSGGPDVAVADSIYYGRLEFVVQDNGTYSNFTSGLQLTGWLDTLGHPGPFTVAMPNNDAFNSGYVASYLPANLANFIQAIGGVDADVVPYQTDAILKGAISFRSLPVGDNQVCATISGGSVYVTRYLAGSDTLTTVNGQAAISLDNPASNGLIQVLTGIPNPQEYPTVWRKMLSDTNMAYFAFAVQRAHLDTLLQGPGPFTVLAPINGAFRNATWLNINLGSLDSIAAADTAVLRNIILYHILPGRYFLNDFRRQLTDTLSVTMLNGEVMKVTLDQLVPGSFPVTPYALGFGGSGNLTNPNVPVYGKLATVGGPYFATPNGTYYPNYGDWPEGNGVVHTINQVLIP